MPDEPLTAAEAPPTAEAPPPPPELGPAACAARLAELFPALFGSAPKPIKLRIQADIQQRAPGLFTKKSLSLFLHRHTTSTAYLKALVASPTRFDLDGAPAGELAEEHRSAAAAELERRRAVVEARRAAEREAQRARQREAFQAERQQRQAAEHAGRQQRDAEFDARRERAALLRAFETTTLTRANFCALKGLAEADLEARLALARQERAERPPRPAPAAQAAAVPREGDRRPPRRDRPDHRRPPGKPRPSAPR